MVRFFSGRFNERAGINFQSFEALKHFLAGVRDKAIADLSRIIEFVLAVVADDDRIEWIVLDVSAIDKLLPFMDPVLQRCTCSFARFVKAIMLGLALTTTPCYFPMSGKSISSKVVSAGQGSRSKLNGHIKAVLVRKHFTSIGGRDHSHGDRRDEKRSPMATVGSVVVDLADSLESIQENFFTATNDGSLFHFRNRGCCGFYLQNKCLA
jgi:hypothetical protein